MLIDYRWTNTENLLTLSAQAMDPTEHLHPLLSERLQFINLHLSGTENKTEKLHKAD